VCVNCNNCKCKNSNEAKTKISILSESTFDSIPQGSGGGDRTIFLKTCDDFNTTFNKVIKVYFPTAQPTNLGRANDYNIKILDFQRILIKPHVYDTFGDYIKNTGITLLRRPVLFVHITKKPPFVPIVKTPIEVNHIDNSNRYNFQQNNRINENSCTTNKNILYSQNTKRQIDEKNNENFTYNRNSYNETSFKRNRQNEFFSENQAASSSSRSFKTASKFSNSPSPSECSNQPRNSQVIEKKFTESTRKIVAADATRSVPVDNTKLSKRARSKSIESDGSSSSSDSASSLKKKAKLDKKINKYIIESKNQTNPVRQKSAIEPVVYSPPPYVKKETIIENNSVKRKHILPTPSTTPIIQEIPKIQVNVKSEPKHVFFSQTKSSPNITPSSLNEGFNKKESSNDNGRSYQHGYNDRYSYHRQKSQDRYNNRSHYSNNYYNNHTYSR
jgi:hypothetical protein